MALTVVDCWTEGSLLDTAREQFEHMLSVRGVPT